jgi:hypothetical protein
MSNLPLDPTLYLLLNLHCWLGGIAAVIAWRKGRSLGLWLLLGLVCGIAAFIVAIPMYFRRIVAIEPKATVRTNTSKEGMII